MKPVLLAVGLAAAACATTPSAPDFGGAYVRQHTVRLFVLDPGPAEVEDTVEIGPTRDGRATLTANLVFDNMHTCWIEGQAWVTPRGVELRVDEPDEGGPFTLHVDVEGDTATLRVSRGMGQSFCGARGRWHGEPLRRR